MAIERKRAATGRLDIAIFVTFVTLVTDIADELSVLTPR